LPYDGNGGYSAPVNSWNPAVSQTVIDPSDWNSTQADYETALSTCLTKDGQTTPTNNLPMGGFKHSGVNTNSGNTSRSEYASGATLQDGAPLDAGYTAGTSTAYTATLTPAIAAYADKQCFRVIFNAATGATPTINFNAVGAKKIYWNNAGSTTQITTNDIPINYPAILRYDATLDTAAGAFWLLNPVQAPSSGSITALNLAASALSGPVNFGFTATVAANALTIAVKGENGSDPSATNVVKIPFQDQAGNYDVLSITAATSLVVPDTATLGTTNAVLYRLWIVGFNDSGTFRLGIINTQSSSGITPLMPDLSNSSTTIGTGSDSAGVIYSGTGVTDKPMVVLGYIEATEATAGTWATAPSKAIIWQKGMKLPGDTVQIQQATKTDTFSTASTSFTDITGASVSITPRSAANRVLVHFYGVMSNNGGEGIHVSLLRDSTQILLGDAASSRVRSTVSVSACPFSGSSIPFSVPYMDAPASTSAISYKLQTRVGSSTGYIGRSTTDADSATYGRSPLGIMVMEIMA